MSKGRQIVALIQEIQDSPEYELFISLRGFNISIFIFEKNFEDLNKLISMLTNDSKYQYLYSLRNRDKLHEVMAHIIRMIHNFVASSLSLIDHTRRVYKNLYEKTGKFEDYQTRIEIEFINDPLSQFIKGLRQYCQHYKSPDLSITTNWQQINEKETRVVELLKDDLIAFEGWNVNAKAYLDSLDKKINIIEIAQIYRTKVLEFYEWFKNRQMEIHQEEFKTLHEKELRLLTLKLENKIETALNQKKMNISHESDEIFLSIFTSAEFNELKKFSIDPSVRVERAIELLELHLPVSDNLKTQIRRWYKEIGSIS